MERRIVITGMGTINPLGHNVEETWESLINGKSGIGPITLFDPEELNVKFACEVKNFDPSDLLNSREIRRRDRFEQFAVVAAREAIMQAGLEIDENLSPRAGVIVSSAIGGLTSLQNGFNTLLAEGARRVSPLLIPMFISNGACGMLSIDFGFQGPSLSIVSACASGADAIGYARQLLLNGVIDVAMAGACEATITQISFAAFEKIGAISRDPKGELAVPKPFDLERDGLVMGEGAAIMILELEEHAKKRGVNILATLAGHASTSDAFHMTAPSEDGGGGALAIKLAMEAAQVNPDQIDYINAHGTGTVLNDISETRAIKSALGPVAYQIPTSSTKSMTGHLMGATGALEAIICVKTINQGIIPPTINYLTPDPECDLDYVPNTARECNVEVVLSNAFGFGGHNAVLTLRKYT
jgi:3-oxoacyl-[acyl-carrier-protein] synthase II